MGKSIPDSTGGSNVLIKVLKRVEAAVSKPAGEKTQTRRFEGEITPGGLKEQTRQRSPRRKHPANTVTIP